MSKKEFLKNFDSFCEFMEHRLVFNYDYPDGCDEAIFETINQINSIQGIGIGFVRYMKSDYGFVMDTYRDGVLPKIFCREPQVELMKLNGLYCFVTYIKEPNGFRALKLVRLQDFGKRNQDIDDILYAQFNKNLKQIQEEKIRSLEPLIREAIKSCQKKPVDIKKSIEELNPNDDMVSQLLTKFINMINVNNIFHKTATDKDNDLICKLWE